jgi:glycine C-acetyltransferase
MRAYHLTTLLHELGVFVSPVAYPAVKPKESRIRVSVNALLTDRDIGMALSAFKQAGRTLGLI